MKVHRATPSLGYWVSTSFLAVGAALADPSTDVAPERSSTQLEEVVVTAQRKEESLQKVPISVTALSASALTQEGTTSIDSLVGKVPGLVIAREETAVVPFLRGVGQSSGQPGVEGSVSIYVDGVYLPFAASSVFDFNNIERLEVLKGPQGTLFGRNATGGVIQIITRTPQQEPEMEGSITYGNYNTVEASAYGTTGVTENLAVDFALHAKDQQDGWGRNLNDGSPNYADWDYSFRGKVLYTPFEDLRITLAGDFLKDRQDQSTSVVPGSIALDGISHVGGFYDTRGLTNDYSRDKQWGGSAHVEASFSALKFISISSYRDTYEPNKVDQDGTPLHIVDAFPLVPREKTITQEFQLQSANSSAISWIAGMFYMHDISGYFPFNLMGAAVAPLDALTIQSNTTLNSFSGFGQGTFEVVSDTHATVGIRYTHDARSITGSTDGLVGGDILSLVPPTSQNATFEKPTWRLSLDHSFTNDILGYVSYNRGFKSGFYNVITYTAPAVKPETIDAYETGVKSEFFDHALRLNSAVYYYKLKDLQLPKTINGATVFLNAASATIKGVDADFIALPFENFTLSGAVAYTHGRYTSFPNAPLFTPNPAGGNTLTAFDAAGQSTVHTPDFSANLNAAYSIHTSRGTFEPSINYSYSSAYCWYPDCRLQQKAYSLVNGATGWTAVNGLWGVTLWAKNMFDHHYYRWAQEQAPDDEYMAAPPRTYGITVHGKTR